MSLKLVQSDFRELDTLYTMSKQKHIGYNLNSKSLKQFQKEFLDDAIVYLNIVHNNDALMGYVVLNIEEISVQLKRIVIDEKYLGIGQDVLREVEQYCLENLDIDRLWLDVYADNSRAIHVYEKLGYVRYNKGVENHREVWFYRKVFKVN